jgi:hypothetical protein
VPHNIPLEPAASSLCSSAAAQRRRQIVGLRESAELPTNVWEVVTVFVTTDISLESQVLGGKGREGEGRAKKKNVAVGYMGSILGTTSVARI